MIAGLEIASAQPTCGGANGNAAISRAAACTGPRGTLSGSSPSSRATSIAVRTPSPARL